MSNSVFNELRLEGSLCDAILKVGKSDFPVHKVVMCGCSPYFTALFVDWSYSKQRVFAIHGVSAEIMRQIVDFAYTGSGSLNCSTVYDLMIAADMFSIMSLVEECSYFLKKHLSPENCIRMWQWTKFYNFPEVGSKAYRFASNYFEKVSLCEDFLQLQVQDLADLLSQDELSVSQESKVYESVMRWISDMPEERQEHVTTLLSKVRLALMDREYLTLNVLTNDLVRTNHESCSMVEDAIKMTDIKIVHQSGIYNPLVRPRVPNAILMVTGGCFETGVSDSIEAFDSRTNRCFRFPFSLNGKRAYHGTAFLNDDIYIVGGFDGRNMDSLNRTSRFKPVTQTWQEVAPMHYQRCQVSVTVLKGRIYALGGFDGSNPHRSAEFYQPEVNRWTLIAPMHDERRDASCTALDNKVYICGGRNLCRHLNTAEYYNPDTNQWTRICPMSEHRSGLGVVTYFDQICVVGGFDGTGCLDSAEAYCPLADTWTNFHPMSHSRFNFGIGVIGHRLFVIGGYDRSVFVSEIECYDPTTDDWSVVGSIKSSRFGMSCFVVSGLPKIASN